MHVPCYRLEHGVPTSVNLYYYLRGHSTSRPTHIGVFSQHWGDSICSRASCCQHVCRTRQERSTGPPRSWTLLSSPMKGGVETRTKDTPHRFGRNSLQHKLKQPSVNRFPYQLTPRCRRNS